MESLSFWEIHVWHTNEITRKHNKNNVFINKMDGIFKKSFSKMSRSLQLLLFLVQIFLVPTPEFLTDQNATKQNVRENVF